MKNYAKEMTGKKPLVDYDKWKNRNWPGLSALIRQVVPVNLMQTHMAKMETTYTPDDEHNRFKVVNCELVKISDLAKMQSNIAPAMATCKAQHTAAGNSTRGLLFAAVLCKNFFPEELNKICLKLWPCEVKMEEAGPFPTTVEEMIAQINNGYFNNCSHKK